ncbi:2977_t:CDS:2, partial [Paraglomus brasilianum]
NSDLVGSYKALTKYKNHEEATNLLKRIASQVKPIMKSHSWRVGRLEEFNPTDPRLLGVNVDYGSIIKIRLRRPGNENSFIDFESLVGTMLHELTHIIHGPHDAKFYSLLDKLHSEYYVLLARGYSGDGFFSKPYSLSAGASHNVSYHEARGKMLEAAEKRVGIRGI